VEVELQSFLTLALNRDEWSSSCPGHFTANLRGPGGAKSKSEDFGAVKTFCCCQESSDKPTCYIDYATRIFNDAVSRPVYTVDDIRMLN